MKRIYMLVGRRGGLGARRSRRAAAAAAPGKHHRSAGDARAAIDRSSGRRLPAAAATRDRSSSARPTSRRARCWPTSTPTRCRPRASRSPRSCNIGERSVYIKALKDGSISFIPEYTGSILAYLDPKATAKTPDDGLRGLADRRRRASTDGAQLRAGAGQRHDHGHQGRPPTKYNLTSIADLSPVASKLTFGAPAQFKTRPDGVPALKSVYGVDVRHVHAAAGRRLGHRHRAEERQRSTRPTSSPPTRRSRRTTSSRSRTRRACSRRRTSSRWWRRPR